MIPLLNLPHAVREAKGAAISIVPIHISFIYSIGHDEILNNIFLIPSSQLMTTIISPEKICFKIDLFC